MSKVWLMTVTGGKPTLTSEFSRADLHDWCKANEGKKLRLAYETPQRSRSQNNYYWKYLEIIEMETGNLADDLHEWAKRKFLKPRFITVKGQEMKIPGTTTGLSKIEFGEYLDKICAETGVPLPDPEDAGYYKEKIGA